MKANLAKRIYSAGDLRDLANGMGVDGEFVSAMLRNHSSDIREAATQVIDEWANDVDEDKAYDELRGILTKIRKKAWISALK